MNLSDFRVVEAASGFCRVEKPHFSWKLRSDERDTKQIKFELVILKDEKTIARAAGEGECVYILPEGEALAPRTQYEARLTVEDNHGCRAEETLVFETDKLSEPFAAKMIAPKKPLHPSMRSRGNFLRKSPSGRQGCMRRRSDSMSVISAERRLGTAILRPSGRVIPTRLNIRPTTSLPLSKRERTILKCSSAKAGMRARSGL